MRGKNLQRITGETGSDQPSGGTLYIVDVEDPEYPDQVHSLISHMENLHLSSGAYGTKARRLVREGKIDVHHPFHALENAFLQVSLR